VAHSLVERVSDFESDGRRFTTRIWTYHTHVSGVKNQITFRVILKLSCSLTFIAMCNFKITSRLFVALLLIPSGHLSRVLNQCYKRKLL